MQCKDQQLRHGEEEYHTALMLYEYDEQIITAHAKIQQLESILDSTQKKTARCEIDPAMQG